MRGDEHVRATTRGRPLKVYGPAGGGCILGFLITLAGSGLVAPGIAALTGGASPAREDLPVLVGTIVLGVAVLALGLFVSYRFLSESLLIFENGFVRRDWRGRERFVPWERLEAIEIRTSFLLGASLFLRYGTVVAVVRNAEGAREEIGIKPEATGALVSNEPSEEIRELASRAGLEQQPGGCMSGTQSAWRRPRDGTDEA